MMRKRDRRKGRNYFRPLITGIILLCLINFSSQSDTFFNGVTNVFNSLSAPVEYIGAYVNDVFLRGFDLVFGPRDQRKKIEELTKENQELKKEKRDMELVISRSDYLKNEKKLLDDQDINLIEGKIVSYEGGRLPSRIKLAIGEKEGVKEGDMIVTAKDEGDSKDIEALVGRVKQVGDNWSLVETIYSDDVNISFYETKTGEIGIINERREDELIAYMIDSDADIKVNSSIVTSGLGEGYEKNILIGRVEKVYTDKVTRIKNVEIEPAVDFSRLYRVYVLEGKGGSR